MSIVIYSVFSRTTAVFSCAALLLATNPAPLRAQTPPAVTQTSAQDYSMEQLDALLAPIALYPDALLTQTLMAATFPLQVVDAARWVEDPANKALASTALDTALAQKNWDPSVKSLVPFPQVLATMNAKLDWMQQVGYAMTEQQAAVMDSVQRLRRQAQSAGQLQTTTQQIVRTENQVVVIVPAQPTIVYVPVYNPTVVYGRWLYPAYPPIYLPPPPGYMAGRALVAGLAFGTGVAISAGLWGWATPNWGRGNINVNVNRFNTINVNRPPINNAGWRPVRQPGSGYRPPQGSVGAPGRPGGYRPPQRPIGAPVRPGGLPANGTTRPGIKAPGNVVRPPGNAGAIKRPVGGAGTVARPTPGQLPANRPAVPPQGARGPGAVNGVNNRQNAGQLGNRGALSPQGAQQGRAGGRAAAAGIKRPAVGPQ